MLFSGLLLALFLEYVRPGTWIPIIGATKIGTIIPLIVLIFAIARTNPVGNNRLLQQPVTKLFLVFMLLIALHVAIAEVTQYSFGVFKLVLGNLFWYATIVKLVTDLDKIRKVFAVLVVTHIILLALNPAVILEPETRSYLRGAPFLGDGNDFSLSVCVVLPMCLYLTITAKSKLSKLMYSGSLVVLVLAIVGTQSRGASLALGGSLMFLWWMGKRKIVGMALLTVVAVGIVSFAPQVYFDRMASIANYEQEGSAMGRITAWKAGLRMAAKYPLTGVGTKHFSVALGTEFRPPEWGGQNSPWLNAHSMYFLVLGEMGIPGFACYMAILLGSFVRLNKLRAKARAGPPSIRKEYSSLFLLLNASLVGYCVAGAFLSVTYYPHIFMLSALIVAATITFERTVAESVNDEVAEPSGYEAANRKKRIAE